MFIKEKDQLAKVVRAECLEVAHKIINNLKNMLAILI